MIILMIFRRFFGLSRLLLFFDGWECRLVFRGGLTIRGHRGCIAP